MPSDITPGNAPLLETFQLFDIAETAAQSEAHEWGEDPGMNLFLEDSIALVRRELETMPQVCAERPGGAAVTRRGRLADLSNAATDAAASNGAPVELNGVNAADEAEPAERARVFVMAGRLSEALADIEHYKAVSQSADIWIFGVPDVIFPDLPNIRAITLEAGTTLARERSVVVHSRSFGAALFAIEAGRLEEADAASRYFEGYLTARPKVVQVAVNRLTALMNLPALDVRRESVRRAADALTLSWHSRLNARFLENLEGQRLALRARSRELENILEERHRLARMAELARGYLGDRTWHELELAVEQGRSMVADRREETTICFCDLVGFTRLSERLHPSEVANILNDHYARLHDIVRAHGGWVDKFIGDAMLAIFDSPVEGMAASQKMVRETREVRVTEHMKQTVQVRVGLNTGVVAVANLGVPTRRERTVLGDAVNLAQRLQSAADPNTVVLSERTFSRLPFALARTLEAIDLEVKGRTEAVLAYRWSAHSDRRAPDERMELRGSLLNAARRAPILERLQGGSGGVTGAPPVGRRIKNSEDDRDWSAVHEPGYEDDGKS